MSEASCPFPRMGRACRPSSHSWVDTLEPLPLCGQFYGQETLMPPTFVNNGLLFTKQWLYLAKWGLET